MSIKKLSKNRLKGNSLLSTKKYLLFPKNNFLLQEGGATAELSFNTLKLCTHYHRAFNGSIAAVIKMWTIEKTETDSGSLKIIILCNYLHNIQEFHFFVFKDSVQLGL
jgi:hypothetical protein